ncbi:MAG: bifunctional helix-turn-helix transcriptional regulator/GNAT family N-acetyltransferase, partial [Solirubrobacteraceae bacterium]
MRDIAQVRRFNRTVTHRIGALSDRFLERDRPLAASRLLWEVGEEGSEVRALRARLELDSGHASRLLRSLEDDGLVEVVPSPADRRVRAARLTAAGRAEWAILERRSDELAQSLLAPLSDRQQHELVSAMGVVERLLVAAAVRIRVVDPADDDARSCLRRYFAELDRRSETGFDPANGVQVAPEEVRPPAGALLVAYQGAEALACGAVRHGPGGVSEIKRMWVSETMRGLGIGRRMLAELERCAAEAGARVVRLDTNHNLVEAIALYRESGYIE